jgi:2,3-bisphosphoglycerate-dependent phosphoglycerate mutase
MAYLALVRHGTSIYNEKGMWTGWDDPELNEQGKKDAKEAGEHLKDIHFDEGYISDLKRHKETLDIILQTINQTDIHVSVSNALK